MSVEKAGLGGRSLRNASRSGGRSPNALCVGPADLEQPIAARAQPASAAATNASRRALLTHDEGIEDMFVRLAP